MQRADLALVIGQEIRPTLVRNRPACLARAQPRRRLFIKLNDPHVKTIYDYFTIDVTARNPRDHDSSDSIGQVSSPNMPTCEGAFCQMRCKSPALRFS